jgi:hypothetical protein
MRRAVLEGMEEVVEGEYRRVKGTEMKVGWWGGGGGWTGLVCLCVCRGKECVCVDVFVFVCVLCALKGSVWSSCFFLLLLRTWP